METVDSSNELQSDSRLHMNEVYEAELRRIEQYGERLNKLIAAGQYPAKLSMPLGIQFELTEKCNLKCRYCYNRSGESQSADFLSGDDWINLAKELVSEGGVFQVVISGGEPLLLKDRLFDIMDVFHSDGARFVLITNGYILNRSIIDRLKKYRFAWLQISIDGVDAATHDSFRGKDGSWDRAVRAAIDVANAGIPLKIASSLQPKEISKVGAYVNQAYLLGASAVILGDIMPSGRTFDNSDLILDESQKSAVMLNACEVRKKFKGKIDVQMSSFMKLQLRQAALGTIDSVIIRPNGDVRLDCIAPFTVGNVRKKSFSRIWADIPGDIWATKPVQGYIDSIDEYHGTSSISYNYQDRDTALIGD